MRADKYSSKDDNIIRCMPTMLSLQMKEEEIPVQLYDDSLLRLWRTGSPSYELRGDEEENRDFSFVCLYTI